MYLCVKCFHLSAKISFIKNARVNFCCINDYQLLCVNQTVHNDSFFFQADYPIYYYNVVVTLKC